MKTFINSLASVVIVYMLCETFLQYAEMITNTGNKKKTRVKAQTE